MGNFYVNSIVRADRSRVSACLTAMNVEAFVAKQFGDYALFTDRPSQEQDTDQIARFCAALSARLEAPCLSVLNHDDDILAYWLAVDGAVVDTYDSAPDYFSGFMDDDADYDDDADDVDDDQETAVPSGGDVEILARAFGGSADTAALRQALHGDEFLFAVDRHAAVCRALGLPEEAAGFGFEYCERGDVDPPSILHDCLRTPISQS